MTKIVRLCYNTSYGALFIASKILVYCLELVRIFNLLDKVFQLLSDNAGGGAEIFSRSKDGSLWFGQISA